MHHHYHQGHKRLRGVRILKHDAAAFPAGTFTPGQVAAAYGYKQGAYAGGAPVKVGVLSLGGSYVASDLQAACTAWGIPMPSVQVLTAGGAAEDPTDSGSNEENALDLQCIVGVWSRLTGTAAQLAICFGPNATGGMLAALQALVAAGCKVISISWGGPDSSWDAAERKALAAGFLMAASSGVTILAASGDNSEDDGTSAPVADYPCSDPSVWAVGGTNLVVNADGSLLESAWGDGQAGDEGGGGGFDPAVPLPAWQSGVVPPGPFGACRGVPDTSACADPNTGYQVCANGSWGVIGGTSASTPTTAAIVAAAKSVKAGLPGLLTPLVYAARASACSDVTKGSNGAAAIPGWDAATGLGSPRGTSFVAALDGSQPAPPPPPPVLQPPAPSGPVTLTQVLAWAKEAIDAGPFFTWRKQVEVTVAAGITKNWPANAPK